jgi:hypothetical protein
MIMCSIHGPQSGPACAECDEQPTPQPCSAQELETVVDAYLEVMQTRGHDTRTFNRQAIKIAAGIHDAWRVAFAKVLR